MLKVEIYIFTRFQRTEKLKKKWINVCKRKDVMNPTTSYICSQHFEKTAYERHLKYELLDLPVPPRLRKLRPGALPTLLLPHTTEGKEKEGRRSEEARKEENKRKEGEKKKE